MMDVLSFSVIADFINKEINTKCNVNISQMRILLFFDKNKNEKIPMGKMASQMDISLSTLSRQLKQKRTKPLVEITRSKNNISKDIQLNNDGIKKVKELKHALYLIEQKLFSSFSHNKLTEFTQALSVIVENSSNTI